MVVRKRRFRLRRWPTRDWERAHVGYRFIKTTFQGPVAWASRLNVKGRGNVPSEGAALLAVNHYSWADPVVVGASIHRPAFYLAKEGLFRNPVMARFMAAMGQIRVNRDTGGNEDVIRTAVEALRDGLVIGVFPEGTRSRPGEVRRGRTGVARIAALADVPVVPIGLDTTDFWPRHAALPRFGAKVYVNIGEPMRLGLKPEDAGDRHRMREATDDVMERVAALVKEATAAKEANLRWR